MNRIGFSLRTRTVTTGDQVGKRQERIRAHSTTGRVAGAATKRLSGSQPSSSTACPAYVLPKSPCPGAPDANRAPGQHRRSPRRAVSCPEVVGGGDQAPLRADGGAASSVEAIDPAIVFCLAEHGLDHRLALAVKTAAVLCRQNAAHECVEAAVPARSGAPALARIR